MIFKKANFNERFILVGAFLAHKKTLRLDLALRGVWNAFCVRLEAHARLLGMVIDLAWVFALLF